MPSMVMRESCRGTCTCRQAVVGIAAQETLASPVCGPAERKSARTPHAAAAARHARCCPATAHQACLLAVYTTLSQQPRTWLVSNILSKRSLHSGVSLMTALLLLGCSCQLLRICCSLRGGTASTAQHRCDVLLCFALVAGHATTRHTNHVQSAPAAPTHAASAHGSTRARPRHPGTNDRQQNHSPYAVQSCCVDVALVLHLKGEHPQQHHKQQHATRPHINLLPVIPRPAHTHSSSSSSQTAAAAQAAPQHTQRIEAVLACGAFVGPQARYVDTHATAGTAQVWIQPTPSYGTQLLAPHIQAAVMHQHQHQHHHQPWQQASQARAAGAQWTPVGSDGVDTARALWKCHVHLNYDCWSASARRVKAATACGWA